MKWFVLILVLGIIGCSAPKQENEAIPNLPVQKEVINSPSNSGDPSYELQGAVSLYMRLPHYDSLDIVDSMVRFTLQDSYYSMELDSNSGLPKRIIIASQGFDSLSLMYVVVPNDGVYEYKLYDKID